MSEGTIYALVGLGLLATYIYLDWRLVRDLGAGLRGQEAQGGRRMARRYL